MPNKIVELQVIAVNAAANMLDEVHAKAAARLVREVANDYARLSERHAEMKAVLSQLLETIDTPPQTLLQQAFDLVEAA